MHDTEKIEIDIQKSYAEFLKDLSFQKYEILSDNPNIFEILRAEKYEIRHSNFLAWLMNPNGNHGLSNAFLKMFLIDVALDEKCKDLDILIVQDLDYSNVEILREWKNIDIVLVFPNLVVAVENKINHFETKGQLEKYVESVEENFKIERKAFIFVNPNDHEATHADYVNFSYEKIVDYLEQIMSLNRSMSARIKIYIEDYIDNLKNNIMDTGEKSNLINKIYLNHKDLIDYIIQNKSSELQKVRIELEKLIIEKGWVIGSSTKKYLRFLTSDLDSIIPKKVFDKDWKEGEAFLFQVNFIDSKSQIITCCAVSPCEESVRTILSDILKPLTGTEKKPKSWSIYKNKMYKLKNELNSIDIDYKEIAEKIMLELIEMVGEVEPLLLNNKDRINKLKITTH